MKIIFFRLVFLLILLAGFFSPNLLNAQELIQDTTEILKAEVVEVLNQTKEDILDTGIESIIQTIKVKVLEGDKSGEVIIVENDYIALKKGQIFFLYHSIDRENGREIYSVGDIDRRSIILFFIFF